MQEKTKRKFLLLLKRKPKKGKSLLNESKWSLRNFATLKGNAQFIFLCNPKNQTLYEPVRALRACITLRACTRFTSLYHFSSNNSKN